MMTRTPQLQNFLDVFETALMTASAPGSNYQRATRAVFSALRTPGAQALRESVRPRCCEYIPTAMNRACNDIRVSDLAAAFAGIEPELPWFARLDRQTGDPDFPNFHASGPIIGNDGLEVRDDVRMGASLLAPDTFYPDHQHPPEEVYIALSPGRWRQNDGPWHEPGIGGLVYNPPNIIHAMHANTEPLLALWILPPLDA